MTCKVIMMKGRSTAKAIEIKINSIEAIGYTLIEAYVITQRKFFSGYEHVLIFRKNQQ